MVELFLTGTLLGETSFICGLIPLLRVFYKISTLPFSSSAVKKDLFKHITVKESWLYLRYFCAYIDHISSQNQLLSKQTNKKNY